MYTREQMEAAWRADITQFLLDNYSDAVKKEGQYLRLKADHRVVFHGNGFFDNGTGEHGGSVEALVRYFGYTPMQAIESLSGGAYIQVQQQAVEQKGIEYEEMPEPTSGQYSRVWSYLYKTRGIPSDLINDLINRRILFQDTKGNAVFINPQGDTAEIRGTNTFRPFKGTRRTKEGGMWYFEPREGIKHSKAYICESAIDCISLYLLIRDEEGVYVSMAGTGNTQIIDRISGQMETIICTDNDEAGQKVRAKYSHLWVIIPYGKDWNEDWILRVNELAESRRAIL